MSLRVWGVVQALLEPSKGGIFSCRSAVLNCTANKLKESLGIISATKRTMPLRFRSMFRGIRSSINNEGGHDETHPTYTAGQQEVTGYSLRDDNDWWYLFEGG
jgi:hypothetical protein